MKMKNKKPMTAREFVQNSDKCPVCGESEDVNWGDISVEGTSTYQDGYCGACDTRFYTVSRLVGYGLPDAKGGPGVRTIEEDFGQIEESNSPGKGPGTAV